MKPQRSDTQKVAVVGLGSVGAMVMWHLSRRGLNVEGFDFFDPGHDLGSAGGESRIFRTVYREGRQYLPYLDEAKEQWRLLDADSPLRLFRETGFVTVGPAEHPVVQSLQQLAGEEDRRLEVWGPDTAEVRVTEHPLRSGEVMLFDPDGGTIRPEASVRAAVALAEARGARVNRYTPVRDVRVTPNGVAVETDHASQHFDQAVLCPGPWAAKLPLLAQRPIQARQVSAFWFPRRDQNLFNSDVCPPAIRVGTPAYSCFPSFDGIGVKTILHREFDSVDPDELPRRVSISDLRQMSAAVEETLPSVVPSPVRTGVYCDGWTPDGHSLLGRLEEGPIVLAAGFSGHGFKLAPALARVVADEIDGSGTAPQFLRPDRFDGLVSPP